jgi:hypothetical protein
VAAVICSLQAAALLQVLHTPARLEALLAQLEPQLLTMPARQLLQLLQALTDLGVEPWDSWLSSCYAGLEAGLQQLQPQQLLQLLQLLPYVSSVQPSRQMLAGLAKMTAVHAVRCSWRQLAVLPLSLAAVGYRPEPYWLKDYVATSSTHMARQQQQQRQQLQQQSTQQQVQLLVDMLLGVSWLAAASRAPPAAWTVQVEQQLVAALQAGSGASAVAAHAVCLLPPQQQQQEQQQRGPLPAETAALVLAAFQQLQHTPSLKLQQLLDSGRAAMGLSSASEVSNAFSSSNGEPVAGRSLLDGTLHDALQPSLNKLAARHNGSAVCPSGSQQQQQQQQQHQQPGTEPQCQSLSQLLQQAGMPQLSAVSMTAWQHRGAHFSKSSSSSSNSAGRRRGGTADVQLLRRKVDDSASLATL